MLTRLAPPTYQRDSRPMAGTPVKWDSHQAQGLLYCVPFWDGAGRAVDELVRGDAAKTLITAADPEFVWGASDIGVGFHRNANSLDGAVFVPSPLIPLPITATAAVRTTTTATPNPIVAHENPSNATTGWVVELLGVTNALTLLLPSVATYTSTVCVVPLGQLCYVAVSATGNGGTVRFAVYNTVTGKLTLDGPTAIGTMDISPLPTQTTFGGSANIAHGGPFFVADARVYTRAMGFDEMVDLVTPSSRYSLFSTGTFTRGSGLATLTLDAPPLTFLELVRFSQSPQVQLADPGLSILELETFDVQETQSGFTTLGAVATPGALRGAVSG